MTKYTLSLLVAGLLTAPLTQPSLAQDHDRFEHHDDRHDDRREPEHHDERARHGRFDHRFVDRDWDRWRGGHWYHGRHEARDGWWWVIGGSWYFYPAPAYPYPDPYALPGIVAEAPPPIAVTPAPAPAPTCREYHGDAIVNGTNQPFYGTACLEPDGQWHIVSR